MKSMSMENERALGPVDISEALGKLLVVYRVNFNKILVCKILCLFIIPGFPGNVKIKFPIPGIHKSGVPEKL